MNAAGCDDAVRVSGSRFCCGSGAKSAPGKRMGCADSLVLPDSPSLASEKRELKSALRTESIASPGATPAVGVPFEVTQPSSARQSEAAVHIRGRSTGLHPCKLLNALLLAVAPPDHIQRRVPYTGSGVC